MCEIVFKITLLSGCNSLIGEGISLLHKFSNRKKIEKMVVD